MKLEFLAELNDSVLEENKGNLAGIPEAWMGVVAKSWGALGGKDSEIKELAAIKNISKFRTTVIDSMKDENLVSIYVEVDGEPFAMIYKKDDFSRSRPTFSIVSVDGEKSKVTKHAKQRVTTGHVKNTYTGRMNRQTTVKIHTYQQDGLPMSSVLPRLQGSIASALSTNDERVDPDGIFKAADISIFGITIDEERRKKRVERSANRRVSNTDTTGLYKAISAADKKFLKKKASEVGDSMKEEVEKSLDSIKEKISKVFDNAVDNKSEKVDFSEELKKIQDNLRDIERLASAVSDCVNKDGSVTLIDRWNKVSKNYKFEYLTKLINSIKNRE